MLHNGYDIPTIAYFENGNVYSGNLGSFRYRIEKTEEQIRATTWNNDLCYELRQEAQEAFFPLDTQGLFDALDWVEQQRTRS